MITFKLTWRWQQTRAMLACWVSQSSVNICFKRDWWFWCCFVPNLLECICANNYFTVKRFGKVITELKWCRPFFVPRCIGRAVTATDNVAYIPLKNWRFFSSPSANWLSSFLADWSSSFLAVSSPLLPSDVLYPVFASSHRQYDAAIKSMFYLFAKYCTVYVHYNCVHIQYTIITSHFSYKARHCGQNEKMAM